MPLTGKQVEEEGTPPGSRSEAGFRCTGCAFRRGVRHVGRPRD